MGTRGRRDPLPVASRLGALVVLVGVAATLSSCSAAVKGAENANLIEGKRLFVARCGACHTLARAETKGIIGPDLDEAFRAGLHEGLVPGSARADIRGTVEEQIKIPNPEGAMPKELAKGQQARDISAYVAQSADAPGKDTGLLATAVEAPGAGKPAEEQNGKLSIPASPSGQLAYVTNKATAKAGAVTIAMPNMSGVVHDLAVEAGNGGATGGGPVLGNTAFIGHGTTSVTVTLKPGTYTFFCQVPGHRAAGMFGTLTVK
jgi:mono/diheme cytochrome c family protein